MEELNTIDINGNECQFSLLIEEGDMLSPHKVMLKVYSNPMDEMKWFSYTFEILDEHTAKGSMMTSFNNIEFRKKGIPERLIERASEYLNRNIISSPLHSEEGNFLVIPSYKAWERLVSENPKARKDETNNHFILER